MAAATREHKIYKGFRIRPSLVRFMKAYGTEKRWGDTSIVEYALEELAKREGYNIEDFNSQPDYKNT